MTSYKLKKTGPRDPFSFGNLKEVVKACIRFYDSSLKNAGETQEVYKRRTQLSNWIHKFHEECGTLTPYVKDSVEKLEDDSCLLLMTAHQPNLFAYSGVLRKATLNYVLAEELSDVLDIPVVNFFGLADQDFADDRWVKSALLPDVERRKGIVELRFNMPEKLMLNRVAPPSQQVLDIWRSKVETWFNEKLKSIERFSKSFGLDFYPHDNRIVKNFEDFWRIVEDACTRAETYSDFNTFIMSKIINEVWGYDTLFSRFSECQQIFEPEFCALLSRFEEYSRYLKEAIAANKKRVGGVNRQEYDTIPFWVHCDCGGKVRLTVEECDESFMGLGKCLRCAKEYQIDFNSKKEPNISGISPRISARSVAMPIIFFDGLKVCCYVGGVGGNTYLKQAKYVGEKLGKTIPPMVVWRPKDIYLGLGQLEALLYYRRISGDFDLSKYSDVKAKFKDEVSAVGNEMEELESRKESIVDMMEMNPEKKKEKIKAISIEQTRIRKESDLSELIRKLKLLKNIKVVMDLHPCIIDYAVSVGLRSTSDQWIVFLKANANLSSNVTLRANFHSVREAHEALFYYYENRNQLDEKIKASSGW